MNWETLSLGEMATLLAMAAGTALWLYLRQPRATRLLVSTLRFWENAPAGSSTVRRWKLREPWAFVAQILFLMLVIAALGNPRWGGQVPEGRSVVIVLDAGAWSQMKGSNAAPWLVNIRNQADDLLSRLSPADRVLLLRADSGGAPVLPFTTDRTALRLAIANIESSSAVADIPRVLAQARMALGGDQAVPSTTSRRELLVYIGPGMMDEKQARALNDFRESLAADPQPVGAARVSPEFLVRLAGDSSPLQNVGITQLALKRGASAPDEWSVLTQVKNYNESSGADVSLKFSLRGQVFQEDSILVAPGATANASEDFTSRAEGLLQAEIAPGDGLDADNRATIALPSSVPVDVAVVTSRPAFAKQLRAVLSANPYVKAEFVHSGVDQPPHADVTIYDGDVPPASATPSTISFISPRQNASAHRVRLATWNSTHLVTRWIQSRDVTVRAAQSLSLLPGDVVLASSGGDSPEPLIVARENNGHRSVVVDFDPLDSNFTEEPAFPLLMAASVEWITHPVQEQATSLVAGALDLPLPISSIVTPSGREMLFADKGATAHFFAGESGLYRVVSSGQTFAVPVNVPPLPTIRWIPTASEAAPLQTQPIAIEQQEFWRWLGVLALIALWLEWRLFYFLRAKALGPAAPKRSSIPGSPSSDLEIRRGSMPSIHAVKTP